jgi:PcfJ-like protein
MQFQLPQNLQTELLAYDPQLKALARQQRKQNPTKKSKYPLGNIPHLIPHSVVRESLQQDAIDNINGNTARYRFQKFTTPVDVATPQARLVTKAILYHYEQCWYAAWLPPKGEDYIYGFATAFKDTSAARKVVDRSIIDKLDECTPVQVGRTTFHVYTKLVTKYDIIDGFTRPKWRANHLAAYYEKGRDIAPAVEEFRKALEETIPSWDDSRETFARMQCNEIWQAVEISKDFIPEDKRNGWELTVDNLFAVAEAAYRHNGYVQWTHELRYIYKTLPILNTPYFRKWIQEELQLSTTAYNNPNCRYQREVKCGVKRIMQLAENILHVQRIWPDCPVDYYQNHMFDLLATRFRNFSCDKTAEWLRQYMPVASFFGMLAKFHEKQEATNTKHSWSVDMNCHVYYFTDWNDTLSMLSRILDNQETLDPPKRWRIAEFHDYVQAESWKISNPNEGLPQDLFPEPIKVQEDQETWTFFQPHDTHQLALWGQAVRNCVGSASGYAEGVRKKQHFIVLCMIDGKPQFTIQLKVSNGMMSVEQIRGLSNSILSDEIKDKYTAAFRTALQQRDSALQS